MLAQRFRSAANGFAAKSLSRCTLGRSADQLKDLPPVGYINLGLVDYRAALALQKQLCRRRIDEIYSGPHRRRNDPGERRLSDTIILLEHPPVYTNGRRNHGKVGDAEIERLRQLDCDYVETNRGGEITFHGPGQLVVYPSLYLRDHHLGTKCYVEGLENTVVETCARVGVKAEALKGFPGVWVSPTQKVAALGTHVQKYVTSHGFALNCTTDMRWFEEIVPCGLEGRMAVSLQRILEQMNGGEAPVDASVASITPTVLDSFAQVFGCNVRPLEEVSRDTFELIHEILHNETMK